MGGNNKMKKCFSISILVLSLVIHQYLSACTIFTASKGGKVLAGNNEDFCGTNTIIHFFPPSEGKYGGVFVGIKGESNFQGGMNDQGLFFDGASTQKVKMTPQDLPEYPGEFVLEEILEKCSVVEEALVLIKKCAMPYLNGCHILIADKTGNAVIIEWGNDKLNIIPKKKDYMIATNFNFTETDKFSPPCIRYEIAENSLKNTEDISIELFRSILSTAHYEWKYPTQYSNICDLKNGDIYLCYFHNYTNMLKFNLEEEFKKGEHWYLMRSLFPKLNAEIEFRRRNDCTDKFGIGPLKKVTFKVIPEILPSDTSQVYITGNNEKIGSWDRKKVTLKRTKNNISTSTFSFHEGTYLEYMITRGSKESEAVIKDGSGSSYNILDVKNDTTIVIKVENWRDLIK